LGLNFQPVDLRSSKMGDDNYNRLFEISDLFMEREIDKASIEEAIEHMRSF
jgi:hypothetical protein